MSLKRLIMTTLFAGTVFNGCVEPYLPPTISGARNYLAISGFLNAGDSSCIITLNLSQALSSVDPPPTVSDASVFVEDNNGISSVLSPQGYGVYSNLHIPLNSQLTYRLHVVVDNGESYYSDYVPVLQTPAIDTVGWDLSKKGTAETAVNIYVRSHGSLQQSQYYFWNYSETWEYTSYYTSPIKYDNGQVVAVQDSTYYCWLTQNSTDILISTTAQLSQNIVNRFVLTSIPDNSIKLYIGYSIVVEQMSLTKDAFEYWKQLKSNTENLGTIFGPLPTQFNGNIYSANNPSEPVFGYFSAATTSEKRIFIKPGDYPYPGTLFNTGNEDCVPLNTINANNLSQLGYNALISPIGEGPEGPLAYYISTLDCVDCRLKGGSTHKPSFWF